MGSHRIYRWATPPRGKSPGYRGVCVTAAAIGAGVDVSPPGKSAQRCSPNARIPRNNS
jgi:hypothetical protein